MIKGSKRGTDNYYLHLVLFKHRGVSTRPQYRTKSSSGRKEDHARNNPKVMAERQLHGFVP